MAKKQVPKNIQDKFDKPLFKSGDAVFFSWLGQKQYGYVTKTKKSSWGIQYMVQNAEKRNYPCGIQISGHRTQYDVGIIFFDETKSIGKDELEKRFNTPRTFTAISVDAGRSTDEGTIHDSHGGGDDANDGGKTRKTRKKRVSKSDVVSSSTAGANRDNTKKRKVVRNSELESAIEKQRNFLNGFIKKD